MTEDVAGCPLCGGSATRFADGAVLQRHAVEYLRCCACGTVFLPNPGWLEEAYGEAISALDVGLLERCLQLANVTGAVIAAERRAGGVFLDFAGGFGTLTRLMRDRGHDFRHHDPLCKNVFAGPFEGDVSGRYDLVTAFEVLEHLSDPVAALGPVAATTDLLLITTQVLPEPAPLPGSWDYYAPETGQHITFATVAGLRALATSFGMSLTTSGRLVHALHRRPLKAATRLVLKREWLAYGVGALAGERDRRRGLTVADSRAVLQSLRTSD